MILKFNPKKILNIIKLLVVVSILLTILGASIFTVSEQEYAVVTTFGKADKNKVYGAGLHFRIPFVQSVHKVNATTQGMELGYLRANYISDEEFLMITRNFNFVLTDFYVEWSVNDPIKFLYNAEDPKLLLGSIVQSSARTVISGFDIDEVLTTGRGEIQLLLKDLVSEKLEVYDVGISILNITLQDAAPPTQEIIDSFKQVENARQQSETEINLARRYANTNIPFAMAEADRIIQQAESTKRGRILEAEGQLIRLSEIFREYEINPEITRIRMYLETMEEILPHIRVLVSEENDTLNIFDLNQESQVIED